MKRIAIFAALVAMPCAAQLAAEPTISADAALDIVAGALRQCRADGQKVSVTVVDASGRVKASVRDDGAAPHTAEHSMRKAYTALSYKMSSADYGKRAAESKGNAIGPQLLPNITTAAGGIPIRNGGTVIGAVGVAGTPRESGGGEHDMKCAEAGIAKIVKVSSADPATLAMALRYYQGDGVKQDMTRAVELFEQAAAHGDFEAAFDLAKMYEYGLGVSQDLSRSAHWYRTAAEMGSPQAQYMLSVFLYLGTGVERDKVEAAKWWTLAMADTRYANVIRPSVESAEAKLTAEELAEGRQRARRWREARR